MTLRLTRRQRAQIFNGDAPQIAGSGTCPVEAGHVQPISSLVTLKVLKVRPRKAGGWSLLYEIHDRRDPVRNLRRTPPAADPSVAPLVPNDERAENQRAAQESAYTSQPTSLSDAGEAVGEGVQKRISKGQLASDAQVRYDQSRAARELRRSPEDRLRDELDALREVAPSDVGLYEAKVRDLADRVAAKRKRRAA